MAKRTINIDEYLVINSRTGNRKWLKSRPARQTAFDIVIRVKGKVIYPEPIFNLDFGEIAVEESEVHAEASMG